MTENLHPDEDRLLDVVLGRASAQDSSQIIRHLGACGPCRTAYDELSAALESLLPAVPEATAPVGFESRVLARLHPPSASPAVSAPPRRRHAVLAAAAVWVLGVVAGGVGMYAYGLGDAEEATQPSAQAERSADLVTTEGDTVGWAAAGYDAEGPVLILAVDDASAGTTFACRGVFEDQSTEILAEWTVYADEPNFWILDDAERALTALELVDDAGRVWAVASW
ncbi:hypothetical protein [Bogoriella caseilytica]|uniref:Uncharacterized protein n=1 Tax=Bogoriella caseilytica TaxID=56055 RepID=A0A3N2BB80_9MICO|nr:hypothetical protein [Bogoriella caseilytica]ROR72511.1 hypothetical protein EDD31_0863 [Bogoriella caseilytica]